MIFLIIHSAPPKDDVETGGAFVCCWIDDPDPDSAELLARRTIREQGWTPVTVDEIRIVGREDYVDSDSLDHYEQAALDGVCFVFHTYPPE